MTHATLTLTKSERVIIRTHWEGELLNHREVEASDGWTTYEATTASVHLYPDPTGVTVDMSDESGNVLASFTY